MFTYIMSVCTYFSGYEATVAHQAGLSMSLSMSMSMSYGYQGTQVLNTGPDILQPASFDTTESLSAPTAKVTTVESGGIVDVEEKEVVVEKAAMNAGFVSGNRNGDGDHPNIFVVLSITAGTVVAVVALARKIGRTRGCNVENAGPALSHSIKEGTVSECV